MNSFKIKDSFLYDYQGTEQDIVIPEGVTGICEEAFARKENSGNARGQACQKSNESKDEKGRTFTPCAVAADCTR